MPIASSFSPFFSYFSISSFKLLTEFLISRYSSVGVCLKAVPDVSILAAASLYSLSFFSARVISTTRLFHCWFSLDLPVFSNLFCFSCSFSNDCCAFDKFFCNSAYSSVGTLMPALIWKFFTGFLLSISLILFRVFLTGCSALLSIPLNGFFTFSVSFWISSTLFFTSRRLFSIPFFKGSVVASIITCIL